MRGEGARAPIVAISCVFVATLLLFFPPSLTSSTPVSAFGDSHVWGLDHIARMLGGQAPLAPATDRAGFPTLRQAAVLGWAPAVLALPLRPLLGPLGAAQLLFLASPALAAAVAYGWLRRATDATPWVCAGAAAAWALTAPALANLAAGNL